LKRNDKSFNLDGAFCDAVTIEASERGDDHEAA